MSLQGRKSINQSGNLKAIVPMRTMQRSFSCLPCHLVVGPWGPRARAVGRGCRQSLLCLDFSVDQPAQAVVFCLLLSQNGTAPARRNRDRPPACLLELLHFDDDTRHDIQVDSSPRIARHFPCSLSSFQRATPFSRRASQHSLHIRANADHTSPNYPFTSFSVSR